MEHQEALGRLEQYIEKILNNYKALKEEKGVLVATLQKREQELSELREKLGSLKDDRNVIHNRVSGLLQKMEEWERVQVVPGPGQAKENDAPAPPKKEQEPARLFSLTGEK